MRIKNIKAFTLIELLMATTVFSFLAIMCTVAVINIGRIYNRNLTQTKLQNNIRGIVDNVIDSIKYSRDNNYVSVQPAAAQYEVGIGDDQAKGRICIGEKSYTYILDRQLVDQPDSTKKQSKHVLWESTIQAGDACDPAAIDLNADFPSPPESNGRELLINNSRISSFNVNSKINGVFAVDINIIFGDQDIITYEPEKVSYICKPGIKGGDFCAISSLSTSVTRRL